MLQYILYYIYIIGVTEKNGVFLLFGGSKEEGEEEQAGGGVVLEVRRWGQRGRHEDGDEVLLCSILLEVLEGYNLYFLWSHSQIL